MSTQPLQREEQLSQRNIEEHYVVQRQIGQGTYGRVYLAECKQTHQKLALKKLSKTRVKFKDFKREFNYSYFLSPHPSIINTFSVAFQCPESWVFVQEFCPAGDILDQILPNIGLGEGPAKCVLLQICDALSFMHSKNLCHRDVKPENIVIRDKMSWIVKLMDFGLTCRIDTLVRRNSHGTPYTPPEICEVVKNEGFSASTSTDVWQTGVTVFSLLTGSFPWVSAAPTDPTYKYYKSWHERRTEKPPLHWRSFSTKLLRLLRKMLHPNHDQRCNIQELRKYIHYNWVETLSSCNRKKENSSGNVDEDDERHHVAMLVLRTRLNDQGVLTNVTSEYRHSRITNWLNEQVPEHTEKN